jgi:hypothetical protein
MRTLFSVLVLSLGALTFQSCEVYPNGAYAGYSGSGYYNGGYSDRRYYGDGYYGSGYGPTVAISSEYRDYDHGYRASNRYYGGGSDTVNRNVYGNRNGEVHRNAQVNRNVRVNSRSAHVNRRINSSSRDHKQQ